MRSTPSSDRSWGSRAIATAGLLVALGAVLGLVESAFVPPLPVPGVRIGIANIALVLALALLGPGKALAVSVLRVVLVGLAAGTLGGPSLMLALAGALGAWAVMAALSTRGARFSVVGWSVAGAAAHVVCQLIAASVLTGSSAPLLFAPVSLSLALVCGLSVGLAARLLLLRLPLAVNVEVRGS
jgi:heptaprenyl diphosphate synthase